MLLMEGMSGFITERDLQEAEALFPGIEAFYRGLREKPATFLDLLRLYSGRLQSAGDRRVALRLGRRKNLRVG